MRLLFFLFTISLFFSCSDSAIKDVKNGVRLQTYQVDSLEVHYPENWKITKQLKDADNSLTSWQPIANATAGLFTIAVSKTTIDKEVALRILKSDVYESLEVQDSSFQESDMEPITFQQVEAVRQNYQASTANGPIEGQFTVLNKSGNCYIIYWQTQEKEKKDHLKAFQVFEEQLKIF